MTDSRDKPTPPELSLSAHRPAWESWLSLPIVAAQFFVLATAAIFGYGCAGCDATSVAGQLSRTMYWMTGGPYAWFVLQPSEATLFAAVVVGTAVLLAVFRIWLPPRWLVPAVAVAALLGAAFGWAWASPAVCGGV